MANELRAAVKARRSDEVLRELANVAFGEGSANVTQVMALCALHIGHAIERGCADIAGSIDQHQKPSRD